MNGCLKLKKQLGPVAVGLFAPQACQLKLHSIKNGNGLCKSSPIGKKQVADQCRPQRQATSALVNSPQRDPATNQTCYFTSLVHEPDLLFHQPRPHLLCRHTSLLRDTTVTPFPVDETCWFCSATRPANPWISPDVPYTSFFPVIYRVKIAGPCFSAGRSSRQSVWCG